MDLNEILGYLISYGIPIVAVLGLLLLIVVSMGLAISWHKYILFGYLLIVLLVTQTSNFGTLSGDNGNIVWVKGTKTFFFSFLDMMIFGTWLLGVLLMSFWRKEVSHSSNPLAKWYVAYGVLFLGYIFFAAFGKNPLLLEFDQRGVINILWQGMFVSLLFVTVQTEKDIKTLTWIIVCSLAGREAWGLFRYAFMGGDPQNYYANFQFLKVKMTFWDINDSILATLMMGYATWKLLVERFGNWEKVGYGALALMGLLTPVLTSRRTAQGGVLLAMILLFFLLPRGRRTPILVLFALVVPLALGSLALRSADSQVPILEKIFIDVKTDPNSDPRDSRFYELETAWKTVREEPFFGVGPSGSFKVTSAAGLYYHAGKYDFVHSGFGHVLLKTGFVGLFIFFSIFVTFFLHVKRGWRLVLPEHKALAVGALCGFTAQIPNFFFGPPVMEIRTMQVGGLMLAIPLICIAIARKKAVENQNNGTGNANNSSYFSPTIPLAKLGKS